ncbi:dienelactone hydrolase [Marinomonas agarivorans]|nr:dienelactone hydrolase [Marinomonas agarivorans]
MAGNRIDQVRPDAPELAPYGEHTIGVRTITVTNPNQIDIVNIDTDPNTPHPRYDRELTLEVWYPAELPYDANYYKKHYQKKRRYKNVYLRDGETKVTLRGKAVRNAQPNVFDGPYPLIIISHGYPGNRFLLSHLAENLASKGYVVAAIDHKDSTYRDQSAFGSTLVNRPLDQMFVLNEMARFHNEANHFLAGIVDTDNTGLIGYSMGGYGALISAGAGVTQQSVNYPWGAADGTLGIHLAGSQTHEDLIDPRLKAVIAIGPWGKNFFFWDQVGLSGIEIPMLYIAGSDDDVSGYDNGVKAIFDESMGTDRYLLTFQFANHNAAAPMPAPKESWKVSDSLGYAPFDHYADPVWDTVRMNNIAQHFATAFMGLYIKQELDKAPYFDLVENSGDGVYSVDSNGNPTADHTYWRGFQDRTAKGLKMEFKAKNQ